ncbi:MAG: hypothetical protein V4525_03730 [Pseudomonadota bacterium]
MFKKAIEKLTGTKNETKLAPETEALIRAIHERSKDDPLIGAKIGSKEIFQSLLNGMKNESGVHVESLLCALGTLAGYSCQASLRAQAKSRHLADIVVFKIIKTKDNQKFFFGDALNNLLANSQYSVWELAAGAAQHAGAKEFPDLNDIFQHTTSVLGSNLFGIPRVPENHKAHDYPINYLKLLWPMLFPTLELFCPNPENWPILYGLAIQEAIEAGKSVINPTLALTIIMECAIPMSKVDFANL